MDTLHDAHEWAESEFGDAAIPDARNVARLVQMARRVAERPLPKVSAVFEAPAELEAAFDFLENERIRPQALVASSQRATARRAHDLARILVPIDEVLLTLPDP
ncbi:MAG: transposase DNA-binding-containing protein, partial [Deltaproteobacteria bacterium]|nr:transposase DNA-binding-containing protein [Deltaproteobacteria bacterium]